MTIQIPLMALLLIIVASGLGALARWVAGRLGAMLVFGKIT